ncbi:MAG: ATP-binding protein [Pseudomonadota bacterium]
MQRESGSIALLWSLFAVAFGTVALVSLFRSLGYGEGVLLGATPASGLALAAVLMLRVPGALASVAGFALAGHLWGLPPASIAVDATAHGIAALGGAQAMRILARRRGKGKFTKTSEWLIFLVGFLTFTALLAAAFYLGNLTGLLSGPPDPSRTPALAAAFAPLGIMTFCSVLLSRDDFRTVLRHPRPALGIVLVGLGLLLILRFLLELRFEYVSPSGLTLMLSVPFCLWVAMQRRSLDGAALSFLAAYAALFVLLGQVGSVTSGDYVVTILYLTLLVATCQLVHAINLDRLAALEEIAAHKRDLERRVQERTDSLKLMTDRALAADAAKSKLVAAVSHEVRTPLNGVIGMASLLLAGKLDASVRRNVEIIRTSGMHMLAVADRVLEYSQHGHEADAPSDVAFSLAEVTAEVLNESRAVLHARGLEIVAEIDPELPLRRIGDRQGLRQVLTNLVGNATKFTNKGRITVRLAPGLDNIVRIEVEDTGIGIDPEEQARIFDPFVKEGGAMARPGGAGLGLAISAEIVERMGGQIGVASAKGSGAVFWVEVALARSADKPVRLHPHSAAC